MAADIGPGRSLGDDPDMDRSGAWRDRAVTAAPGTAPAAVTSPSAALLVERLTASHEIEGRRWARWGQRVMLVQALALAVLAVAGLWALARSGAPVVTTAGFRFGMVLYLVCALAAVATVVAAPVSLRALSAVAVAMAIAYLCLFLVFGAWSGTRPAWDLNAAGALLLAGLAIAAFAEAVLLNAAIFDPAPGSLP